MPEQVVLATNNPKKLAELRRILNSAGLPVEVLGLRDVATYPEPEETERTFEGNAFLKATAACRATGLVAVADDSGLEVEELNDMPGVRSARWAGPACDDEDNNQLLLAQLDGVPAERRKARFVCALAMVTPEGDRKVWHGRMPGRIAETCEGEGGFGYDPIFVPAGLPVTSAELTAEEKDSISHRGIAVRAFVAFLKELS
ncbi:MAG TPA: RdgB/HAM1 family non-canonical purine NTP pyrophosphatase [Tessaracoccus flavescens]|uniref:dITP/XTP pyrophosphatase n=1 Tax=Tessaracoccus flavescens TaxID=399497 RepID=A0A921EN19_9ACTN|nr:RdgB/HAM1 family non-canonical purine NTP pyrophosphatase [Tessaracoccus flavescens]